MKKVTLSLLIFNLFFTIYGQIDTIAEDIFGNNGKLGIGISDPLYKLDVKGVINTSEGIRFADGTLQTSANSDGYWQANDSLIFRYEPVLIGRQNNNGYFNDGISTKMWVHNGWLQVSDSTDHDAGIVINHLNRTGYGFARSLHQVYNGVTGDPYTEFRIRGNDDSLTLRSWTIGIHHMEDNKLKINTIADVLTGSSPSFGENMLTIKTNGFIGIGTTEPLYKLDVVGIINTSEGIRFPDGTIQTSANSDGYWQNNDSSIYRYEPVLIGRQNNDGYFNKGISTKMWVHNGWLQVSDSTDHDAGIVINHLNRAGYGFARSLHQVYNGVTGDPYTEFRIRENDDMQTVRSWALGIDHSDDNKFKINTDEYVSTGSSPSYGENMLTIATNGYVGIGTSEPKAKVEVADGDIMISDINHGIIMKSPDGRCWKGTLDNNGTLNFVQIDCQEFSQDNFNKAKENSNLSIYPNPVKNVIIIASTQNDLKNTSAILYSMDGKIVKMEKLLSNYSFFDLNDIEKGTYFIKVVNKRGKEIGSEKVIKY